MNYSLTFPTPPFPTSVSLRKDAIWAVILNVFLVESTSSCTLSWVFFVESSAFVLMLWLLSSWSFLFLTLLWKLILDLKKFLNLFKSAEKLDLPLELFEKLLDDDECCLLCSRFFWLLRGLLFVSKLTVSTTVSLSSTEFSLLLDE